ncbi:MAG: hypothetical protein AB1384_02490 [Actinomycetota bacterium]
MDVEGPPRVRLLTQVEPPRGSVMYQAIPEMVAYERGDAPRAGVRTLAFGRLVLALEGAEGELVGVQCHVKTGRWKREDEPPPEPDAEGVLLVGGAEGEGGITFIPSDPAFFWHEESYSLHILLKPGLALVFKVADCLLAGVDAGGNLTDIWMLGLDLALE